MFFFFFQAEDGIRDFHVTGVQTCALPISARRAGQEHDPELLLELLHRMTHCGPGDAELARRAAEAPEARHREECLELWKESGVHLQEPPLAHSREGTSALGAHRGHSTRAAPPR